MAFFQGTQTGVPLDLIQTVRATRVHHCIQANTGIESHTIYSGLRSNTEIQCLGSGCKQQDYAKLARLIISFEYPWNYLYTE